MRVIGVIPARYKSSRFPGKPLAQICGKPMIIWVCEKSASALGKANIVVATDDDRIASTVEEHGFQSIKTSSDHLTGTDRIAEVATKIDSDIYMNIQGDEPVIKAEDIIKIKLAKIKHPNLIINGMSSLLPHENPEDLSIPKVVTDVHDNLLYMSRSPIPGVKTSTEQNRPNYQKQVCIYAFNKSELMSFAQNPVKTKNEQYEDIEILRFLDLGFTVRMIETSGQSLAVDYPEDIVKVEKMIRDGRV